MSRPGGGLRIAALVKQIPAFEAMDLTAGGRLQRSGVALEMSAYCRRAVSEGVALAQRTGGTCTVLTLGPESAEEVLREALAWGADRGLLVSDPAFAGSDTLATARALAAALEREGPFDLILAGRNSLDADTGQVGPEVAELLDLPFLCGVRELELQAAGVRARCEQDDGWLEAQAPLPAVLSVAERLCKPCKAPPEARAAVPADRIGRLSAAELGPGPWGEAASPTRVGALRQLARERHPRVLEGTLEAQVQEAVAALIARGVFDAERSDRGAPLPEGDGAGGPAVGVLIEPDREHLARELCAAAADLAAQIGGHVVAILPGALPAAGLGAIGADRGVRLEGAAIEENVARGLIDWAQARAPWAILAPGTAWGREVASRAAARLGAGLTGDAIGLEVREGRLVAWKPAFGGKVVAAITATSPVQMATVRPGVLPLRPPRGPRALPVETLPVAPAGRVRVLSRSRDDRLDALVEARYVIGVGTGVPPAEYDRLAPLRALLGAELAATRKVTDLGWQPRARQVGITGRSIAPRLYVALGMSGKFNHVVGLRNAGTVLAVNSDPEAPILRAADLGIVGDWHEAVVRLAAALERAGVEVPGAALASPD